MQRRAYNLALMFLALTIHRLNMDLHDTDLNLLVYLDVLLREKNVTRSAMKMGITQPAMSNVLKRLRLLLDDPILVKTAKGMTATERALKLQPLVRQTISNTELIIRDRSEFKPLSSQRTFRVMASDYAEAVLIPAALKLLREQAPNVTLDVLTPSDVSFSDIEQGRVDMAVNRFEKLPQSFHQKILWEDSFSCLVNCQHPILRDFSLENYLKAQHLWVSKTGYGIGVGIDPGDIQRLGWVDLALDNIHKKRKIRLFTRHYQVATMIAQQQDLIATVPTKIAKLQSDNSDVVLLAPPFEIAPLEMKMAWSALLHHNNGHRWMRSLLIEAAGATL